MRNSTTILATVALGAMLAIGSATASMARGDHDHGDRGPGGGDHGYGLTVPFITNNGGDTVGNYVVGTHHASSTRGFGATRHYVPRQRYLDGFLGLDPFFGIEETY